MKHGISFVDVSIPYQGYKLSLHLERIEDVGEFTLFCLRAFGDGLSLSDLSQVTAIDRMTIQKHLDFLVKREFVDGKHLAFYNLSHSLACFSSQTTSPLAWNSTLGNAHAFFLRAYFCCKYSTIASPEWMSRGGVERAKCSIK